MTYDIIQERTLYVLIAYFVALFADTLLSFSRTYTAAPIAHVVSSQLLTPFLNKLDKTKRTKGHLIFRGLFIQALISLIFVTFSWGGHNYIGAEVDVVLVALCISPLLPSLLGIKLYKKGDVSEGELYSLAKSANVNLNATDAYGVTREAINWQANSFGKNLVAPMLIYVVFGLSALYFYSSLTLFAWVRGKYGNSKGFAKPTLLILAVISVIPEYVAALSVALAAYLTPKTRKTASIKSLFSNNLSSAEGGVVTYTYAHTLNITLGGAAQHIDGGAIHRPWTGDSDSTAKIEHHAIKKSTYLTISANIILIFGLTLILL